MYGLSEAAWFKLDSEFLNKNVGYSQNLDMDCVFKKK